MCVHSLVETWTNEGTFYSVSLMFFSIFNFFMTLLICFELVIFKYETPKYAAVHCKNPCETSSWRRLIMTHTPYTALVVIIIIQSFISSKDNKVWSEQE